MGAGASSLARLRKVVVIRSYNLRKPNQTIEEQFKCYTSRNKLDGTLYIKLDDIRQCLVMDSNEYSWIEDLFLHTFGGNISEINFQDFIKFLESGKVPVESPGHGSKSMDFKSSSSSTILANNNPIPGKIFQSLSSNDIGSNGSGKFEFPPIPPHKLSNIVDKSAIHIQHIIGEHEALEDDCVININLSNVSNLSLPDSVKLRSENPNTILSNNCESDEIGSYSIIIHHTNNTNKDLTNSPTKPLWRKREIVRQERTVHYTTIDEDGAQQELVEKEITQSEVLHMECRETGEFAHRETTQYEQMETFNEEVVAETQGAEEYVHLKSLDDEFHYMESTMPPKKNPTETQQQRDEECFENSKDACEDHINEEIYGDEVHVQDDKIDSSYIDNIYNTLQEVNSNTLTGTHIPIYNKSLDENALREALLFVEGLEEKEYGCDRDITTTTFDNQYYLNSDDLTHLNNNNNTRLTRLSSKDYLFENSNTEFQYERSSYTQEEEETNPSSILESSLLNETANKSNGLQTIERSTSYESLHDID